MPNDYILRSDVEKLIKETISKINEGNRKRILPNIVYEGMEEILNAFLSEISSIQSVDRWIPVSERLPEEKKKLFVI